MESTPTEQELIDLARGIHDRVITLDTHDDIDTGNFTAQQNYTADLDTQVNLPKMEEGGLDVAWFIVYTGQGPLDEDGYAAAYANADDKFNAIHRLAEEIAPDQVEIAYNSDDVRRIVAAGKKVIMIGVENAWPVGLDLSRIEEFHTRGGRYMSLAHNGHNQFADSHTGEATGEWRNNGLSDLGRQAVVEMNRLGIMVDVSHPSRDAIMQMLDISRAPVIASHSAARALSDVSRNLDDEQLLRIRDGGGVVQAVAFSGYVDAEKNAAHQAALDALNAEIAGSLGFELLDRAGLMDLDETAREVYRSNMAQVRELAEPRMAEVNATAPPVDVADFVNHIDYLVDLIGIDHVGISSDFDGGGGIDGWNDASETFNVTLELVRRGYSEAEIAKLWSGNLLRVLDDVQRIAAEIQAESEA
ncbi:MAG: membrane dipeptidase [Pseudomonadales bacterium]|nr:membrane dipeptidase [Pseudomonadales bacterium]